MNPDAGQETTRQQIVGSGAFREMAERGLELAGPGDPEAGRGLEAMQDFYGFWERELSAVLARWDEEKRRRDSTCVFDWFYRAEAARTRVGGGTGLGLAIARVLARAQGGDLVAENGAAGGAVVSLRLPRE